MNPDTISKFEWIITQNGQTQTFTGKSFDVNVDQPAIFKSNSMSQQTMDVVQVYRRPLI